MHVRPDGDTVGSCAALCRIFEKLGRKVYYACPDPIPDRLAFLVEGLTAAIDPIKKTPLIPLDTLTPITVDVPSIKQLGFIAELVKVELSIDHHAVSEPFAPNYTVGGASSAGEVLLTIADLLAESLGIELDSAIATSLYAAIASDTGGFAYRSATPTTYRHAARLIELGAEHTDVCRRLFSSKPLEQLRAEAYIAESIRLAADGRISYALITSADIERLGFPRESFDDAISIVRSVAGAELAFTVREIEDGSFKVSLRSTDKNVAEIAKRHSGGGHALAAACTPMAKSADEAAEIILAELSELLKI